MLVYQRVPWFTTYTENQNHVVPPQALTDAQDLGLDAEEFGDLELWSSPIVDYTLVMSK